MNAVRQAWTDERLDDLATGMHREFDQVHAEFGEVRAEIRELRTAVLVGCGSIVASVVGSVAAVLVAHAL